MTNNKALYMLLAPLTLLVAACGGGPAPNSGVSSVSVTASSMTISSGATTNLTATVTGTGNFSPNVTWSVVSGGGTLTNITPTTATYTAPSVTTTTSVLLRAASTTDPTVKGEVSITVSPTSAAIVKAAVLEALPDLKNFQLVKVQDGPIITSLTELAQKGGTTAVSINLPILNTEGKQVDHAWTLYPVNVRGQNLPPSAADQITEPREVKGPSLTFQGVPDLDDEGFKSLLSRYEETKPNLDESTLQASVLNVIGSQLQATYFGNPDIAGASVLEGLQTVLEPKFGAEEAKRIAALSPDNYLLYRQADYQPAVTHGESELPPEVKVGALNHVGERGIKVLHPVMVADATIYNPDTGTWLLPNWFARVDGAANLQNFMYMWAQFGPDFNSAPTSALSVNNNRIFVRTRIGAYKVLTKYGKSILNMGSNLCGGSNSYLGNVRQLSTNSPAYPNEYWMWWTIRWGGGCAYVRTINQTPRNGAVGVSGYSAASQDWVSFVFMHEGGHIIGGTHTTDNTGNTGETWNSQRCRLLGIWPFGPVGPSLMSYAGGTRTYCFAATDHARNPVNKNLTKVAEFLHNALR